MYQNAENIARWMKTTRMSTSPLFKKQGVEVKVENSPWSTAMPWWNLLVDYQNYQALEQQAATAKRLEYITRFFATVVMFGLVIFILCSQSTVEFWFRMIFLVSVLLIATAIEGYRLYLNGKLVDQDKKLKPLDKIYELARELCWSMEQLLNCPTKEEITARADHVMTMHVKNVLASEKECARARRDLKETDLELQIMHSNGELQRHHAGTAHKCFEHYRIINRSYKSYYISVERKMSNTNNKE